MIGTSNIEESEQVEFSDTHPSDACRFKEHFDQLKKGNWWSLLNNNANTSYIKLIKKLAAIKKDSYVFESDQKPDLAGPVLKAFIRMKPKIATLVDDTFGPMLRRFRGDCVFRRSRTAFRAEAEQHSGPSRTPVGA
jgi:hypothetical protein